MARSDMESDLVSVGLGLVALLMLFILSKLMMMMLRNYHRYPNKSLNLPPSPPAWPIVGHLHLLGVLPHQSLAHLAHKYGPLMFLKLGSVGTVAVSDAALAREFLKTHDHVFASRPRMLAGKILFYDYKDIGWSQYGPYWREIRKICQLELFTSKRMEASKHIRMEEVSSMLKSIRNKGGACKVVDVNVELFEFTRNTITRMMLNKKYFADESREAMEFKHVINEVLHLLGVVNIGDFIPSIGWLDIQGYKRRMKALRKRIDVVMDRIIKEHQYKNPHDDVSTNSTPDFIDVLLSLINNGEYKHLDIDNVKAIAMDIFSGGTDTSASTIEWALSEILLKPPVQQKAQEELDQVVGLQRNVEESDLPHLKYLQAILKETFRLHPVVPLLFPHESTEAVEVGGYCIPAKTRLLVNAWAIGRDSWRWERALDFCPERFEGISVDVRGQDFELIPFGSGRRSCPGLPLGLMSVQLGLAALLQSFQWSLDDPSLSSSQKLDMSEAFGISLPKAIPLKAVAIPRLPHHLY